MSKRGKPFIDESLQAEVASMDVATYLDNRLAAVTAEMVQLEQRHAGLVMVKAELTRMRESVVE